MAFYTDENGNVFEDNSSYKEPVHEEKRVTSFSLSKVFLYMFGGLLITAAVAAGLGALFTWWLTSGSESAQVAAMNTLFTINIIASIATIVLTVVMAFALNKTRFSAMLVPAILYAVCTGIMLSTFTLYMDWKLIAGAFGITALIFGLMSLISLTAKNMSGVYIVGIGLISGAGLVSLFTWILMILSPATFQTFYWIVSLGMFAGIMFITMFDIWRMKQIANMGAMSNNIALYCAFTLYVDFIYIFVRILSLMVRYGASNNE